MIIFWIILAATATVGLCALLTAYICFRRVFYNSNKFKNVEEYSIPDGEIYEPYREDMISWIKQKRALPHTEVSVTSHDGLTLRGEYFEYAPGAPIELMFHGYRGNAERDLSGGVLRCRRLGHSTLLVDHRAAGKSEGQVTGFGILEARDCLCWIDFIIKNIDPNAKIILTGVSMGAATVTTVTGYDLPGNVVGVLADCGYTSTREIICKVVAEMKLPPRLLYPFIRLGARLFGHFDTEFMPPIEAVKKARVPIIFIHGDADDFVPCHMSRRNYEACVSPKRLVIIKNGGHGLAYPADPDTYLTALHEFFDPLTQ